MMFDFIAAALSVGVIAAVFGSEKSRNRPRKAWFHRDVAYASPGEALAARLADEQSEAADRTAKAVRDNNANLAATDRKRDELARDREREHAAAMGLTVAPISMAALDVENAPHDFKRICDDYKSTHPTVPYGEVMKLVATAYPDLARGSIAAGSIPVATSVPSPFENPSSPAPVSAAVRQFDALVADVQARTPGISFTNAVLEAARRNPELAHRRNVELSTPVGPGGVPMQQS